MRKNSAFFVLVVAVVLLSTAQLRMSTARPLLRKIEELRAGKHGKEGGGGSESWAKDKLSEGLGFKYADDQELSDVNDQLIKEKAGYVKNKACESKSKAAEAYENRGNRR